MTRYATMAAVKRANADAGFFFFGRDTMNFFGSKLESGLYDGRVFITSEYDGFESRDAGPGVGRRVYTVREALADGSIQTIDVDDVTVPGTNTSRGPVSVISSRFSHLMHARQFARDYVRGVSYVIETKYDGRTWELSTAADSELMARANLIDYRVNQPGYTHRIRRVTGSADV
ncbi:hypothetical protein [Gordonia phage GTE5]|uniref:Uncharacterized protein n=1 Tax=Gordonia phage GTE5 TaxID=319522 RepID=G8EJT4_9CAUD|nr:hypothetical protein GoPhGTE5p67 [Gordonia phage GTE5]AET09816.1 hypothetical protein [Gordonia phage GTE5]